MLAAGIGGFRLLRVVYGSCGKSNCFMHTGMLIVEHLAILFLLFGVIHYNIWLVLSMVSVI